MSYYDPYAGGFRGLTAGLNYLQENRRREEDARQFDANYRLEQAKQAKAQNNWQKTFDQGQANWKATFDRQGEQWNKEHQLAIKELDSVMGVNDSTVRVNDSVVRSNDANTEQTRVKTEGLRYDNERKVQTDARSDMGKVMTQLTATRAKYEKEGKDFFASPEWAAAQKVLSTNPAFKAVVDQDTGLKANTARIQRTPDGSNVIVGESERNGQTALVTAKGDTYADNTGDGAVALTDEETWALFERSASQGDYTTSDAFSLAAGEMSQDLAAVRAATQPAPQTGEPAAAPEQTGGFRTPPGGARSRYRGYPTADQPAPAATTTQPAVAPPATSASDGVYRSMVASNAMGFNNDQTAAAGQGFGFGPTAQGQAVKSQDAATRVAEAEAKADILDPNRDVKAAQERGSLLSGGFQASLDNAIVAQIDNIDTSKSSYWKDSYYETYRESPDAAKNAERLRRDVQVTLSAPTERAKVEAALGKPAAEWNQADMESAVQIVLLSRKKDHITRGLMNLTRILPGDQDRDTSGQVTDEGIKLWQENETTATRGDQGFRPFWR